MEIAAAGAPSVCIPAPRPFQEQRCKAAVLKRLNLSVVLDKWPGEQTWPSLMKQARNLPANRWDSLQDSAAPARVAGHIAEVARRCARPIKATVEHIEKNKDTSTVYMNVA